LVGGGIGKGKRGKNLKRIFAPTKIPPIKKNLGARRLKIQKDRKLKRRGVRLGKAKNGFHGGRNYLESKGRGPELGETLEILGWGETQSTPPPPVCRHIRSPKESKWGILQFKQKLKLPKKTKGVTESRRKKKRGEGSASAGVEKRCWQEKKVNAFFQRVGPKPFLFGEQKRVQAINFRKGKRPGITCLNTQTEGEALQGSGGGKRG